MEKEVVRAMGMMRVMAHKLRNDFLLLMCESGQAFPTAAPRTSFLGLRNS